MNTVVAAATWHYQKAYLISGTKTKQGPSIPFADQGIFAGGGGVLSRLLENSSDNVFFSFLLLLNLFKVLKRVSNGYFKENYYFPRFQRGVGPTFSVGGGSKCFNKICDFSGSSGATIPPLDPRMYPIVLNFGLGPSYWRKCPQTQWLLNVFSTFYVKF